MLMGLTSHTGKNYEDQKKSHREQELNYNNKLITDLKDAHGSLFSTYLKIEAAFREDYKKWHEIMELVKNFETSLKLHVMLEDKQLYTYLEDLYKDDSENLEHLRELKESMDGIVKEVKYFSRKYSDWENYSRNKDSFISDLTSIGKALTSRVEIEETFIYPMYMENH